MQETAQNEKYQLHPSHTISQEHYSLWSWFLVHLCKLMISRGVFFFVIYIFPFFGLLGGKRAKNYPKWKLPITSIKRYISGTVWSMIMILVHLCKMISPRVFFFSFFYIFSFFGLSGGVKGQKWHKMTKNYVCCTSYLRSHISCDCHLCYFIYGTHV